MTLVDGSPSRSLAAAREAPAPGRVPPAMWAIAAAFLVKAAVLALFVTPLWDVPDEVAHFATVDDLASGRGVPRPGRAVIAPEIVALWNPDLVGRRVDNWVAVHPPGYHLLAVPFLWASRAASPDVARAVRATRLLSALIGAAGLLVFYRVLRGAGADQATGLAGAASVGCLPMYSHMSSGVSHDVLCALLGGLAAVAFLRLVRTRRTTDALATAAVLAAAGLVKATAVPVAAALLVLVPVHLDGRWASRFARAAAAAAMALSTSAAWALWQARAPAPPDAVSAAAPPSAMGLLDGLRRLPIVDHTFKNFFGLIGWTGTGHGAVRWFQISGAFLAAELVPMTLVLLLAAAWVWRRDFGAPSGAASRFARVSSWASAAAVYLAAVTWLSSADATLWPKALAYGLFPAVATLSVFRVWRREPSPGAAVFSSQFTALVFASAYLVRTLPLSIASGGPRATHGRYFFVTIGFLLAGFFFPAADRVPGGTPRNRLLLGLVLVLAVNETLFFFLRVAPFYREVAAP